MSYNSKIYMAQGGDDLVVAEGGKITDDGTQASHIEDLAVTTDLTGVDTATDMTAAQAAQIEADLAATQAKLNAILAALEGVGILAAS